MNELAQFDNKFIDGLLFAKKAYDLFEKIRSEIDGGSKIRMLETDREKKLLEEILPIATYIHSVYRAGRYISVCWHYGNQNFDAVIKQTGWFIENGYYSTDGFLEVTCVMHSNEYLVRERINTVGYAFGVAGLKRLKNGEIESEVIVHDGQNFIEEFALLLIKRIENKISKSYPSDTTLIVRCSLNYLCSPDDWSYLKNLTTQKIISHPFTEIYVYDSIGNYSFMMDGV